MSWLTVERQSSAFRTAVYKRLLSGRIKVPLDDHLGSQSVKGTLVIGVEPDSNECAGDVDQVGSWLRKTKAGRR